MVKVPESLYLLVSYEERKYNNGFQYFYLLILTFQFSIALFLLNRLDEAAFSIDLAEKYGGDKKFMNLCTVWKSKIYNQLGKDKYDENFITVDEIPNLTKVSENNVAKTDNLTKPSSSGSENSNKSSNSNSTTSGSDNSTNITTDISATSNTSTSVPPAPIVEKVKFDWYQNSESVNVSLFVKNAPKEQVKVDFTSTSAEVSFPLPGGSEFTYDFDPFFNVIDTDKSTFRVFGTKIELTLQKAVQGKWSSLLGESASNSKDDRAISTASAETIQKFVYPTSSKSGPKQWDSIMKEELEDMEKQEGDSDPNAFFKKLFENADEDTKRAMMKSYTESNGTALSTSWEDASKKVYETTPPDGMVAKNWK